MTVVAKNRINYFGEIQNATLTLSQIGKALDEAIHYAKTAYGGVDIPQYVIKPNHFHAIIYLYGNNVNVGTQHVASAVKAVKPLGSLRPRKHPDIDDADIDFHFNSRLAVVIRGIKSAVTRYANKHGWKFAWQGRFHDRIIRSQKELNLISEYIDTNVLRWDFDCYKEG